MAYRDVLLTALTYADATPDRALRSAAAALAKRLDGQLPAQSDPTQSSSSRRPP